MNRYGNFKKLFAKTKKKDTFVKEEAMMTFKELKREQYLKNHKNYDNALRSKNLDRLMSYDEE